MKIFIQGNVINCVEVEFKDKETQNIKKTKKLQFLEKNEKGVMDLIDIKLDENEKIENIKSGTEIMVQIEISNFNGKTFYKQVRGSKIQSK